MFPEKVREILENVFYMGGSPLLKEMTINQVLPQLLSLIENELLPKEKHSDLDGNNIKPVIYNNEVVGYADKDYENGFNRCLLEIKEKLNPNSI